LTNYIGRQEHGTSTLLTDQYWDRVKRSCCSNCTTLIGCATIRMWNYSV